MVTPVTYFDLLDGLPQPFHRVSGLLPRAYLAGRPAGEGEIRQFAGHGHPLRAPDPGGFRQAERLHAPDGLGAAAMVEAVAGMCFGPGRRAIWRPRS